MAAGRYAKMTETQKEKVRAHLRASYAKHRAKRLAYCRLRRKVDEQYRERAKDRSKAWRKKHPEKHAENDRQWKADNRKRYLAYMKAYNAKRRQKLNQYMKTYHAAHQGPEHKAAKVIIQKRSAMKNRHKRRRYECDYMKRRYASDPYFALICRLRARLRAVLRGVNRQSSDRALELCGCTLEELKRHIESKFTEGMSWERLAEIHIDHIRPIASFDLTSTAQKKACFHWTNLQPLWASANLRKGKTVSV